jgi:integrase/recombinase XerD
LNVIQRQLGHADLGITSVYLQGIDTSEIVDRLHARSAPTIGVPPFERTGLGFR